MRVGLFGVAGYNRGDDAISFSLARWIKDRLPTAKLTIAVLQDMQGRLESVDEQVVIDRRSVGGLFRLARSIRKQDVILLGGGSLIQDKHGGSKINGPLGYAWFVTLFARAMGTPVMSVALGVDQLGTKHGRDAATEVLGRLKRISVRDPLSAANVRALVGDDIAIIETPDPAFSYQTTAVPTQAENYIVLAPAFEGVGEEKIVRAFSEVARTALAKDPALLVRIISMEERLDQDAGKIHLIRDALPDDQRDRISLVVPHSPKEAAEVLRGGRGVVAMRLHAMILAYGFAPLFCLSRTTKTEALMREYLIPGRDMEELGTALAEEVIGVLENAQVLQRQTELRIALDRRMMASADTVVSTLVELADGRP